MRTATVERKTAETEISLFLNLDGNGKAEISTGCGFLDHMLTLFASHSGYDLTVSCKGDTFVDYHHTAEDIGICLGTALRQALGDKRGIRRYADKLIPMDEALILCAIDISGRGTLCYGLDIPCEKVGDFDTELTEEFFLAVIRESRITLHLRQLAGKNSHHIIEGAFKAFARSLSAATETDPKKSGQIPSTKGVL